MAATHKLAHSEHVHRDRSTTHGWLSAARGSGVAYRRRSAGGARWRKTRQSLLEARDNLDLAAWSLEAPPRSRRELAERNERARDHLLEAARALSLARVHHPGVRSLARPVILAGLKDPKEERARLRDFVDRLLWWNHEHLPARIKALPLTAEEEAQLARVLRTLDGQRRLEGLTRHRWFMAFAVAGALTPVFGAAAGLAAVAFGGLELAGMVRANGLDPELAI